MDQDTVVNEQVEGGRRLIEALAAAGFHVPFAFWAMPTEDGQWFLYLASATVDEKGPMVAYRFVFDVLRQTPGLWIDPLEIKVIGLDDSLTHAVLAVTTPHVAASPFAKRNPRSHLGMTRLGETTLGGLSIDGAWIYPPFEPAATS